MNNRFRILSIIILASMILMSCTQATTTEPVTQPTEPPPTDTPVSEGVTLKVWDIWTRTEETAVVEKIHAGFEAAHPGVKIVREVKSFDDMKATAKLALSSADGPDVAQINQGLSDMGALVKAGLLENLTPYAQQYGWDKKVSAGIVARNSFTPDGNIFGQGNLYGIAPTAELVGVFYRKDKFEEFGLSVPKTFADFENILKTIKDKGDVPIVSGNLGGLASTHYISELLYVYVNDRAYVDDLIYGQNDRSWDTPEVIQAATKLVEWTKNGYFTPGFEGIDYDSQQALFENGEGDMMLTGSWWSSAWAAGPLKDKVGFFLVPPMEEGAFKLTTGGTSTAYAIRSSSANKELAAEYIDYMISDTSAKLWIESQTVPVPLIDPSAVPQGTMFGDLVTAWNAMNKADEVGHYLDWATPTFYDTITSALEELMGMQLTPEEFAKKLQTDYGTYLESK